MALNLPPWCVSPGYAHGALVGSVPADGGALRGGVQPVRGAARAARSAGAREELLVYALFPRAIGSDV
eukprot:1191850-Pyramimonas_sp.AAC.1